MTDKMKQVSYIQKRAFHALAFAALVAPLKAQTVRINVDGASFTKPLIEKLVSEYQKIEPGFNAQFVDGSKASDATVSISDQSGGNAYTVARFFLLPIANAEAQILRDKKVQKGMNQKLAHEIFVERSIDEQLDNPAKKSLPSTVYALSGKYSASTALLAKSLNVEEKNIRGKKILGREENVLSVVRKRADAIAVNVASLVYDSLTRKPVSGVAVLPVDLDGNNKVTAEEREALGNIDQLTAYLDSSANALPTGDVSIETGNPHIVRFVQWASGSGQHHVAGYGYLKANSKLTAQK